MPGKERDGKEELTWTQKCSTQQVKDSSKFTLKKMCKTEHDLIMERTELLKVIGDRVDETTDTYEYLMQVQNVITFYRLKLNKTIK